MNGSLSDVTDSRLISTVIIQTVANAKDVEPTELEIVLEDYIDTDAVERLASKNDSDWTLTFDLPEHTVTVTGDKEQWLC